MIDLTILVAISGFILNAIVLLIGFTIAFTKIGGRLDLLEQRLGSVEETLKHQRDVAERLVIIETRQATHGQMIAALQTEILNLRHGRGFVQPRSEGGINGEYP